MDKKSVIELVGSTIARHPTILSARIYGSWLCDEKSVDLDIAIVVKSENGVVDSEDYRLLRIMREGLCVQTGYDIDLVPHTADELSDMNSPVWYPRYNPSLVFGQDIKGALLISQASIIAHSFEISDLIAYVLHDNRTICRRQLVRSLSNEEGRIFVSKLLHGPGNALTYYSCKNKIAYKCSPSELSKCFELFDELFEVNSFPAMNFLKSCKANIDLEGGIKLIGWYENLFNLVLKGNKFRDDYKNTCNHLEE